jgi:tRNA modification GTPase
MLFNALIGQPRALVSPRAGTTRDYLSALCDCGGLTVELIDTAGVEPGTGRIEGRAQALRAEQEARADLRLVCESFDTEPATPVEPGPAHLRVWNKCDLAPPDLPAGVLMTSARTGAGLDELRAAITAALQARATDGDSATGTGARCRESLAHASHALRTASETLLEGGGDELVALDLRQAVDELGKVVGAVVTDDILDRIFRRFCIGK